MEEIRTSEEIMQELTNGNNYLRTELQTILKEEDAHFQKILGVAKLVEASKENCDIAKKDLFKLEEAIQKSAEELLLIKSNQVEIDIKLETVKSNANRLNADDSALKDLIAEVIKLEEDKENNIIHMKEKASGMLKIVSTYKKALGIKISYDPPDSFTFKTYSSKGFMKIRTDDFNLWELVESNLNQDQEKELTFLFQNMETVAAIAKAREYLLE